MANPLSQVRQVPARLLNCMVKVLNECKDKLPQLIIMILDSDLVRYIQKESAECDEAYDKILYWLVKNIEKSLDAKKDDLYRKRKGAIAGGEPKIIWVAMLNHMGYFDRASIKYQVFNKAVLRSIADRKHHYYLDITVDLEDSGYFTKHNNLTGDGRVKFWKSVDQKIKDFDYKHISLKPNKNQLLK